MGTYQRGVAPAPCIQQPNVALQSHKEVTYYLYSCNSEKTCRLAYRTGSGKDLQSIPTDTHSSDSSFMLCVCVRV